MDDIKSITSEQGYIALLNNAEILVGKNELTKEEDVELDSLVDLITDYEKRHYPI